jgi:replicative DNA helicase
VLATLPHSIDAERTVLGAVLVDNQAFYSAAETLSSDHFYRDAHRRIFEAYSSLSEKSEPIDLVTVKNELSRTNNLDAVGGVAYLAGLVEGVPRLENVDAWARLIKESYTRRMLMRAAQKINEDAASCPDSAEVVLDRAEHEIFQIADGSVRAGLAPLSDFLKNTFEQIERQSVAQGAVTGLDTGFVDLNRLTGGFQPGELIILAARPAMGKTSFALNMARHVAEQAPVAIFSLEMSKEQLTKRLIFSEARVDSSRVHRGQLTEMDWSMLTSAWASLNKLPIMIDDSAMITPLEIRAKCRRMKAAHGLGLVVLDYLQLMTGGGKAENRQQEVSAISRGMKILAKELDVPVLALSQLSRKPEERTDKRPQLSDLRESGSIEQDADVVMFLYRESVYNKTEENRGTAELIISKQRNGPTDVVPLTFLGELTRFENAVIDHFKPEPGVTH